MEYRPLKSTNNKYGINENAEIIKFENGRIIKPYIGADGYQHCVLFMNGKRYRKRVHRLMAEVFFHNAKYIDHINENRADNRLENLQAISNKDNVEKGQNFSGYFKKKRILVTSKETGEKTICDSVRSAERLTGVDRHRIRLFCRERKGKNYTRFDFEYIDE